MCTICVSEVALPWSDKVQWAFASGWALAASVPDERRWLNGLWSDKGRLAISDPSHFLAPQQRTNALM